MNTLNELMLNPFGIASLASMFVLAFTDMVSDWPVLSRVAYAIIFSLSSLHACSVSHHDPLVSLFVHAITLGTLIFTFCMYMQERLRSQDFLGYYDLDSRSQYVHQDP